MYGEIVNSKLSPRAGSGNERAADPGATARQRLGVDLPEADAHRRQDGDVQHGLELAGQLIRIIYLESHAAVAQIEYRGRFSVAAAEHGVGTRPGKRNALPFAQLLAGLRSGGRSG